MSADGRDPIAAMADAIVARLEGQCMLSLESIIEEEGLVSGRERDELVERVEEQVFLCDGCGWWCSTDELNNETSDQLCDDCKDD